MAHLSTTEEFVNKLKVDNGIRRGRTAGTAVLLCPKCNRRSWGPYATKRKGRTYLRFVHTSDRTVCYTHPYPACSCGGRMVERDGESVCQRCGLVHPSPSFDCSLPFGETYALTSELAFDKSLGGTLRAKEVMEVLKDANNGWRSRMLAKVVGSGDHPFIRRALSCLSSLIIRHNLQYNHVLANDAASIARRMGAYFIMTKSRVSASRLAELSLFAAAERLGISGNFGSRITRAHGAARFLTLAKMLQVIE